MELLAGKGWTTEKMVVQSFSPNSWTRCQDTPKTLRTGEKRENGTEGVVRRRGKRRGTNALAKDNCIQAHCTFETSNTCYP